MVEKRDHGGGLDAAMARFGGARGDWLDLSTGINPVPYPVGSLTQRGWTALPDQKAMEDLLAAARSFWQVPDNASILAAHGASALIARLPALAPAGNVHIPAPTYNEHAAAFDAQGWSVTDSGADAQVLVHPNNPTGRLWSRDDLKAPLCIIDESFCDVAPQNSLIDCTNQPGRIVLKSFGKFWGLAGLRLGFAIGAPDLLNRLTELVGPWAVSGPALEIGARALGDEPWADETRERLCKDADRLDRLMTEGGASPAGGTSLFRLYEVDNAQAWQVKLANHHIWTRVFPYSEHYLRLGLPAPDRWDQLVAAL